MSKRKRLRIERIDWVDSSGPSGWHSPDIKHVDLIIKSIGWVTLESKKYITLVGHIDAVHDNHHSGLTIPKCAVIKRKRLKP